MKIMSRYRNVRTVLQRALLSVTTEKENPHVQSQVWRSRGRCEFKASLDWWQSQPQSNKQNHKTGYPQEERSMWLPRHSMVYVYVCVYASVCARVCMHGSSGVFLTIFYIVFGDMAFHCTQKLEAGVAGQWAPESCLPPQHWDCWCAPQMCVLLLSYQTLYRL